MRGMECSVYANHKVCEHRFCVLHGGLTFYSRHWPPARSPARPLRWREGDGRLGRGRVGSPLSGMLGLIVIRRFNGDLLNFLHLVSSAIGVRVLKNNNVVMGTRWRGGFMAAGLVCGKRGERSCNERAELRATRRLNLDQVFAF